MRAPTPTRLLRATRLSAARSLACLALFFFASSAALAQNPVVQENAKAGTSDWRLTNPATAREIEGYASATSVNRGGQITLYVNTSEPSYTIEVYRMGWYGGAGARRVLGPVSRTGTAQPTPTPDPATGLVECRWTNGYLLTVPNNTADPTDWLSGVYLARLTASASGKQSYVIFVVRDDARAADYLFQTSVNTYQAYNNWGGKSLYDWNSAGGVAARKVSFNRPYAASPNPSAAYGVGSGEFITNVAPGPEAYAGISSAGWEYNFVRWLEREGYDVAYCTNVDAHADANFVRSRRAFLSVGHDEYWSWQMRENVEAARGRGVGLGFFSANTCYWQVRFEPGFNGAANRTMVGYKYAAPTEDPFATDTDGPNDRYVTTFWRDNPVKESEGALLGVMYTADPVDADIVIEDPAHWSLANTGLRAGDRLAGLLGYEVDKLLLDIPAGTQRVASSPFVKAGVTDYSHMVSYVHASGANVFSTGSIQWSWGLDDFNAPALRTSRLNWAAQHVTRNVLARLANRPEPPAPPPPPPTPTPTPMVVVFSDNFDDNARDASKWALGTIQGTLYSGPSASDLTVPALEQNGRLEITPLLNLPGDHYNGFVSAAAWDMTGGSASVEVVSAPTDGAVDTELAVCLDGQNFYMIVQESGRLYFQDIVAGARNSSAAAYNPAQQRFWRIRHDPVGDLVLFETSADRLAWVVQRTIPRSLPLASVKFELSAGTWRIETLTGTARFDNFRLEKPSTATPTPTPTPTSTPTPTPANKPPVANPGGPYSGTTGTAVQFDGTRSSDPDGTIASYTWNFGDGTTATGARPLKTYTTAGTYTVRLTVRDNLNASHSATTTATITIPPPNAPTALDATAISSSQIKLTWRDNSTGETGFKIERSTSSTGGFVQIATVGRGVTTYTNGGRASRTTYYYRVRAYGDGGNSAYTNVDGARTF